MTNISSSLSTSRTCAELPRCFAKPTCQISQSSSLCNPRGAGWIFLGTVFFCFLLAFFDWAGGSRTGNRHADHGGRACTDHGCSRKTQNCRRFWPLPLLSSRLKSVHSHGDRGVLVAKLRTVVAFGFACCPLRGTAESWSRNAELSSLLASLVVLVSQKMSTVTGIWAVVVAKCRSVNSHKDLGVLCLV